MTRTKIISILTVILCVGAFYGYHVYARQQFEHAYRAYSEVAARHDEAALIPMVPENPLRRDLNAALADVLTGDLSPQVRIARAEEGLALLVLSEGHIDAVGELSKDVTDAILTMEDHAGFALLLSRSDAAHIIDLAHRRTSIVGDIRGLSYRANHHTKEIFERIRADNGALTPEHAASLERLLPDVEEQFNRRSNLSAELESIAGDVRTAFAKYDAAW